MLSNQWPGGETDLLPVPATGRRGAVAGRKLLEFFGQVFDAGETFSGLGAHLDDGFAAVEELKTELANALAGQGGVPAAVQAKMDALDDAVRSADEALSTPPAPAPQPPSPAGP